jgi:hypothetical protein
MKKLNKYEIAMTFYFILFIPSILIYPDAWVQKYPFVFEYLWHYNLWVVAFLQVTTLLFMFLQEYEQ